MQMVRCSVVLFLLGLSFVFSSAEALRVESKESSLFLEGLNVLPRSVQLSNKSFCFFVTPLRSSGENGESSARCSFDGGANVKEVKTTHNICTSGLVVDHQLHCPNEELPHDEDGELEFSSITYKVQGDDLKEEESQRRFLFKSGAQTGEVKQILFNGNAVHLEDEDDAYVLVSTIVNDAEERKVVVFRSEDGFVFKAIAVIPGIENAKAHHLLFEGGRRLTLVSAHNSSFYTSTSTGYAGTIWSQSRTLNVTSQPASAAFSSGVLLQRACSNETSKSARWYLMEDTAKRPLGLKSPSLPALDDAGGSPLLLFSVAASDDSKELVVVHGEAGPNTLAGVRISAYQVDDSTEAKEKAERIAKEKEELLKREAARFKARMERMEREKAQRREQRRVDLERKRKFLADDAPNVLAAKLYMDADDEMIIIRRVHKETIALEKEVFFSDL